MFLSAKYYNFTSIMPFNKIPKIKSSMFFKEKETNKTKLHMAYGLHGSAWERKLRTTASAWRNFLKQKLSDFIYLGPGKATKIDPDCLHIKLKQTSTIS